MVDDDPDIHILTRAILRNFTFDGMPVLCLRANSGLEARQAVQDNPDLALVLMDVVMESDHAGLAAVRFIREELGNRFVRIALRTGQPGFAPEHEVIARYDINDYREKSDLSAQKLVTVITTCLRNYRDLRAIQSLSLSKELLEERVQERTQALMLANEALQKNRESLARAQAIAHFGNWDWDLTPQEGEGFPTTAPTACQTIVWSDELYRILGLASGRVEPSLEALFNAIHPDERQEVTQAVHNTVHTGIPFTIEHRVVRLDGSERIVRHVGELTFHADGRPKRFVGIVNDITQRRRAEDGLKIATRVFDNALAEVGDHLKITARIFENAIEAVMVTDRAGIIQSVNPAFTAITGFTTNEAIGKNSDILSSERHDADFFLRMREVLFSKGSWRGEVWNRRKDGEAYPSMVNTTAIRGSDGEITHFVSVSHDLTDLKRGQEELHYKTFHDALTGLPNRTLFLDRMDRAVQHARRTGLKLAVAELDLDQFKHINESRGHAVGDEVLQQVSARFHKCMRQGDTVSRLGGDSFAFIIREVLSARDAVRVARKVMTSLLHPLRVGDMEHVLTASMGIALFPSDGDNASHLMQNVGIALNRAKRAGRDNFQFYSPDMGEMAAKRLTMETSIRKGLERKEFILHYQPKVNALTGQIVGMESLLRWNHPQAGLLGPGEFIPLAEETGLIVPLGEWVLHTACAQAAHWVKAGHPHLQVAVNLSARQFRRRDIVETVRSALHASGLPPENLELEITESMVMDDVEEAITILKRLSDMGPRISVDDFGTGYSSLNYLKRFPIRTLKIDQSFVRNLPHDMEDASIVAAIISMARSLHLKVVAEGVESEDHLSFLKNLHCDEIQGYLFSRPVPPDVFTELLATRI